MHLRYSLECAEAASTSTIHAEWRTDGHTWCHPRHLFTVVYYFTGGFCVRPRVYILVLFETAIEQIHRRYCYKNYFPFLAARTAAQGVWHFHLSLSLSDYVKCVYTRARPSLCLAEQCHSPKENKHWCRGKKLFSKNRYNVIKRAGASFHPLNSYS
jgi:hypothetical protein